MQVQKLQNGNVRLKEQHSLAEENMRSLHASELSAKDGDIRLLQERCDDAIKQNEVQRTGSAAKVCPDCSVNKCIARFVIHTVSRQSSSRIPRLRPEKLLAVCF